MNEDYALYKIQEAEEEQGEVLHLNNLGIEELPESIGSLVNLTRLILSENQLTNLPESIGNLANLTELNLEKNKLTSLPESLGKLINLNELYLSENKLTSLPESLGKLIDLNRLYLGGNKLTSLPESLGKLVKLHALYLWENQLTSLPESLSNLTNLNVINLGKNPLRKIPGYIGNFSKLTEINLGGHRLTQFPGFISNLTSLTKLNLANNQLISLPKSVSNLTKLHEIYLEVNFLKEFPEYFSSFTSLTKLNLGNNQLTKLPESIRNFSNLNELILFKNRLKNLPKSISNLTSLTKLNLENNQLIKLPESIGNLSNLEELNLRENNLRKLPESIGNLSDLIRLDLDENPLIEPPLEIAVKGIEAIKNYFSQFSISKNNEDYKGNKDYLYEAKLLIVGEAGAGKTTLAKKIQDPQYHLQESEPTTEGIDVIKWSFPLPDKEREFKVNIWDFGGQEIYHATHQFFLTKRSLYTLVADSRKEDTDFYYWLNVVQLLSDNSPLLIIKNEKQEYKREINERALRGQFTNLKETLATNLATNKGLEEIITNIKYYIQKLPHIGQTLPKTWVTVRQALEQDSRNYISLQEYLDICETNGFTKLKYKLQLSGYFHDLGVCLHFQDKEESPLYKIVILKPEWGTDAVYKVLRNQQVINNQGHFTRNDLKNIWHEEKYASMRGELLELMKKFQLCYEIPARKDTFIAPQLLSENHQPEYDWDESNNLILRYAYPDFMPKGIITRFIVIMHEYIHSSNQNQCVWRSGVVLEKDDTLAEIIENYGKREIKIRVFGDNKRDFLTIIANEIDKISDSYKRLNYQKLIPCNCEVCKPSDNPHFYDFKVLKKFIRDRQREIQCQQSYKMVNIVSLIDDVIIGNDNNKSEKDKEHQPNKDQSLVSVTINNPKQQQGNKNIMSNINQSHSGSGDNIGGNKNITNDQSRTQNISGGTIHASGSAAFGLGDISGTIANTINQLPSFDDEPNKKELTELLSQLQSVVLEEDLDDEEKKETLEQINEIAEALQNSQDGVMKKTAKRAMKMLRGTAAALPPSAAMVTICNQLPDLISKIF